jgi:hypothetical protein
MIETDLEQNIGGIEIPMAYALGVHILHATGHILEDVEHWSPPFWKLLRRKGAAHDR